MAYLKRQFKTIAVILVPLAVVVFVTSTEVVQARRRHDGRCSASSSRACSARSPSSPAASCRASPASSA